LDLQRPTGDDKPARRQQQRSVVTQQKLLDAAIEAFSENGFRGSSTREIADRAGVHHPLITYHFRNKDRLWRASVDRVFREFNTTLVAAMADVADLDLRARAAAFIRCYVHHSHSNPALHKIILQESSAPSDRLDWLVEAHLRPLYEYVVESLVRLQEMGVAPPGNPGLLFNMIRVSAGGLLALKLEVLGTSGIDLDDDQRIDELANMIIRVFLPNEAPEQPARGSGSSASRR
jgi:TetR/AcrR family transcriptional regulator